MVFSFNNRGTFQLLGKQQTEYKFPYKKNTRYYSILNFFIQQWRVHIKVARTVKPIFNFAREKIAM